MQRLWTLRVFPSLAVASLSLSALFSVQGADSSSRELPTLEAGLDAAAEPEADDDFRLREGLILEDEIGEFRDAGGRITFYPSERKVTLTVLENLALERVYGELEKRRERRMWAVTGVVTEYRGGNFLQITRAIMKPKAAASGEPARRKPTSTTKNQTPRHAPDGGESRAQLPGSTLSPPSGS